MKEQFIIIGEALLTILAIIIGGVFNICRRLYRRFCIKVLWKQFRIETSTYRKWHDKRVEKLQLALDNAHSAYPSF